MSGYELLPVTFREIQEPIPLAGNFECSNCDDSSSDGGTAEEWERKETGTKWTRRKVTKQWRIKEEEQSHGRTRLLGLDVVPTTPYTNPPKETERGFQDQPPFPSNVFYIIGSEFCERFCYYGLRAVLLLYLSRELLMTEKSATSVYHGWSFLCYFTPILGAILADSFFGKYRTILCLSMMYLAGNIVLSIAATKPLMPNISGETVLAMLGLVMIAFGAGGIKPCVSAFSGDQFQLPQQEKMLTKFFTIFYFSINAGSLFSSILTPIMREDVSCFGGDCFPLAFGLPAVLMLIALVVFVMGTPQYKMVSPEGNITADVVKCILYAAYRKITTLVRGRISSHKLNPNDTKTKVMESHWLHLAADRFSWSLINDVKLLVGVLVLYLPLPFFWALYEQQGSRWTFQATKMSGSLGSWTIKPDQMQVMNPILLLLMIPFFDSLVYPFLTRFGLLKNPLQRMFVGGLLACLAFIASGITQLVIENSRTDYASRRWVNLVVVNTLPCPVRVSVASSGSSESVPAHDLITITFDEDYLRRLETNSSEADPSLVMRVRPYSQSFECQSLSRETVATNIPFHHEQKEIFVAVTFYLEKLSIVHIPDSKPETEAELHDKNEVSTIRIIDSTDIMRLSPVYLHGNEESMIIKSEFFSKGISFTKVFLPSEFRRFEVALPSLSIKDEKETNFLGWVFNSLPSSSVLLIYSPSSHPKVFRALKVINISKPSIHMFWLLPQYILISAAEVMFVITGLEFSFKQAPASMKSVVQAAWLITNAFGNLYVVIIAESTIFKKQSMEFFCFAGLMFLDMLIFHVLARRFKYPERKEDLEMLYFSSDESDNG